MRILKVLAVGIAVGGVALAIHTEKAEAAEWSPRSAEQIKADISGNEYTIVWGDTLSAISEATNITVGKLAQWNSISNIDLIFAGNTISWDGDIATMKNSQGNTISQALIQETPADRVDPTKPIGGGNGSNTSNNGSNGSGNTNNTTNPPVSGDTGSSDNGTSTPPASGDNGSSDNGTTTPPASGDNSTPNAPTIVTGYIGNTGKIFNTRAEANAYGYEFLNSGEISRFVVIGIFYSDGSEKASLDFYY